MILLWILSIYESIKTTFFQVTAGDMSHTPLESQSVDIAVFCLSLMGTNIRDYIKEANRVLKIGWVPVQSDRGFLLKFLRNWTIFIYLGFLIWSKISDFAETEIAKMAAITIFFKRILKNCKNDDYPFCEDFFKNKQTKKQWLALFSAESWRLLKSRVAFRIFQSTR